MTAAVGRRRWLLTGSLLATPLLATALWLAWPLPRDLLAPREAPGIQLLDRYGNVLRASRAGDGSRHRWLPLSAIDADVLLGFIAMEDARFFEHRGIDARAVGRAMWDNLRAGRVVSGASTITMQTARLAARVGRGWLGKLRQALWALRIEIHADKQTILEYYLNRVPLGQATVGVAAASALYFGRSASDLSLGQAALLAGLAHAPSRDDPFVAPQRAMQRRQVVLRRVLGLGGVTERAVFDAAHEPLITPGNANPFFAPHYTSRLLVSERVRKLEHGSWHTSLDLELQSLLELEVRRTVADLADVGVRQAALVVLHNATGEPLAWIGSPDFWADSSGQVDMVVSRRQPGSLLKPFLYGMALDRGYTPASILADVMRTYLTDTGPYAPRNYDRRYHGPVRIREALASSYNVPAVELTNRIGVAAFLETLHAAGFTSLVETANHYGLGLALGNGEVTLLEVADAYRALARGGVWRPSPELGPRAATMTERRIMSARSAFFMLDVLADPVARLPGFGATTVFDFGFPTAVKTGTSHHFTDNWAVAVTGGFTIAVWVGNFSGRPMERVSGISGAGPLLHRAVLATARRYPAGTLPGLATAGAAPHRICQLSGLAPGPRCPTITEWFADGSAPARSCDWHTPAGVVLPDEFTEWLALHPSEPGWYVAATAPESVEPPSAAFRIIAPETGDVYRFSPGVDPRYATIALRAAGGRGEPRWLIDGKLVEGARWRLEPGRHTVRAETRSGASDEVQITVEPPHEVAPAP